MGPVADGPYRALSLFDAETVKVVDGQLDWLPVRRRLGGRAFGTNAYRARRAGDLIVEDHVESPGQEEMYVVVRGAVRFSVGGDEVEAPAGTVLYLPDPQVRRSAVATEDESVVLAVGGWPDKPYRSLPWEPIFLAQEAMRAGDWASAAEIIEREAEHNRDHPRVRYRLAYCLARAGDRKRATEELRAATEKDPTLEERARDEEAFAGLDLG
jgi:tetratricopeptide (TPR) repeat protein